MRTDSPIIDPEVIHSIREIIVEKYGNNFLPQDQKIYKSKSKQVQEGHEAIRPTDVFKLPKDSALEVNEKNLYELIWNRAVSSQMESAKLTQTEVLITSDTKEAVFKSTGTQIIFKGFLEVYEEGVDNQEEEKESFIPSEIKEGDDLILESISPEQHFTKPPPRYTEASMIKELDYDPKCEPIKGWYVQTLQEDKKGNLCLCRYCANGSHASGKRCLHCEGTGIQKHTWTTAEYNKKKKIFHYCKKSFKNIL